LLINDLLQRLWQIGRLELEMAFCGNFLSKPQLQHVVAATKGDGTRPDNRDNVRAGGLPLHACP
jgi:hypothetical protein